MKVLANGEYAKVDKLIHEKDACISDPTSVAIAVLNIEVEKLTGFGKDTIDSLAIYIREMKK